jgi:hypothetical protein
VEFQFKTLQQQKDFFLQLEYYVALRPISVELHFFQPILTFAKGPIWLFWNYNFFVFQNLDPNPKY